MKIYIAGPMNGYEKFNFPAFDEAAERLRAEGHEVFNPADHDREIGFDPDGPAPTPEELGEMFAWDLECVRDCHAIIALEGWRQSKGANVEIRLAEILGKTIVLDVGGESFEDGTIFDSLRFAEDNPSIISADLAASLCEFGYMRPQTILAEAEDLISTERQEAYGHPADNFANIAAFWSVILKTDVLPRDVGLCMAALKIAREAHMPQRDNLRDAAGYLGCVELVDERSKPNGETEGA